MFPKIIDSPEGRLLWLQAVDSKGKAAGETLLPVRKISACNGDHIGTLIYMDGSDEPVGVPYSIEELIKSISFEEKPLTTREGE
jgi:hypothetical protein